MHSITQWNLSQTPNYVTNVNKKYPYSEVPYIGQYNLVKIPVDAEYIDHVDYWGEGRIIQDGKTSGFADCYNVNHQYQPVSNGTDRGRKIPNRIPVISYTNCYTGSYVKHNSVKLVTLMGAPINKSCAKDIARMVNAAKGKVVVFGFQSDTADIRNLEEELGQKGLAYCQGYNLPEMLLGLSLFDDGDHRAYLNLTDISEELYNNVENASFENAIKISQALEKIYNGSTVSDVVTRLLKEENKNIITYAYKLWNSDGKDIVTNYFPLAFKLILNEDDVTIINKENLLALKLDTQVISSNDRLAWGDTKDKTSQRVRWKFVPVWEKTNLYFKIKNIEHNMYLKLDSNQDNYGVRKAWGSTQASETRFQWTLEPLKVDDDVLFYIINADYKQGLKLDVSTDSYGDRPLVGNNGSVYGNPEVYGWYISPWVSEGLINSV